MPLGFLAEHLRPFTLSVNCLSFDKSNNKWIQTNHNSFAINLCQGKDYENVPPVQFLLLLTTLHGAINLFDEHII